MSLEQSILKSTKKILNIAVDDPSFDQDIITHINSAFSHLHQLGIGPTNGFVIDDDQAVWSDFLNEATAIPIVSAVKTNVFLRVRSWFDPPQLPHVMNAMQAQLLESDVRLSTMREETEWADPDPPALPGEDEFEGTTPVVIDGGGV